MSRRSCSSAMEGGRSRAQSTCTDQRMEEMAAAMKAVCDAAKADKARQDWLEAEVARQGKRANAAELEKAALQDRVKQLEAALEEQGQKAALAWKWQQEVARLQEKLGKRSLEVLARDQELEKVKKELKQTAEQLAATRAARAASSAKYNRLAEHLVQLSNNVAAAKSQPGSPSTSNPGSASDNSVYDERPAGTARSSDDAMHDAVERTPSIGGNTVTGAATQPASRRTSSHTVSMMNVGQGTASTPSAAPVTHGKAPAAVLTKADSAFTLQGRGCQTAGEAAASERCGGSLSAVQEGIVHQTSGNEGAEIFGKQQESSLTYANYNLTKSSSSVSGSSGKRGMLSMLKTTHIAAAVASALSSPRSSKGNLQSSSHHKAARAAVAQPPNSRASTTVATKEDEEHSSRISNASSVSAAPYIAAYPNRSSEPYGFAHMPNLKGKRNRGYDVHGLAPCASTGNLGMLMTSPSPQTERRLSDINAEEFYDEEEAALASHYVTLEDEASAH